VVEEAIMAGLGRRSYRIGINGWTTALLALALSLGTAAAQQARAPKGPVEITVGSSAGSTPDVLMRRMIKVLNDERITDVPMAVVNRPGGAWTVGMKWVLGKPGDENLVFSLAEPVFSTPIVQGTPAVYDQFTPLGVFVQTQLVVVVQPDHEAKTLSELVDIARAKPRQVKVAGSSVGSTDAQVVGLIEKATGTKLTFVPHDGGGAAQATFLGRNVDMIVLTVDEALPIVQAGKGKILAILNEKRRPEPALKDIATAKEQGVDVVWGQIFGLVGPPNLDPAVAKWWDDTLTKLVQSKGWQDMLRENYLGGDYTHGPELKPYLDKVNQSRLEILRALGVAKL
jgi:putative tricarboxylic transport membrane protein